MKSLGSLCKASCCWAVVRLSGPLSGVLWPIIRLSITLVGSIVRPIWTKCRPLVLAMLGNRQALVRPSLLGHCGTSGSWSGALWLFIGISFTHVGPMCLSSVDPLLAPCWTLLGLGSSRCVGLLCWGVVWPMCWDIFVGTLCWDLTLGPCLAFFGLHWSLEGLCCDLIVPLVFLAVLWKQLRGCS